MQHSSDDAKNYRYGKDDKLGFLNRLTPDVVLAAAKEIKTGKRISLDWALDAPQVPLFGRPVSRASCIFVAVRMGVVEI